MQAATIAAFGDVDVLKFGEVPTLVGSLVGEAQNLLSYHHASTPALRTSNRQAVR
jgi:hypothetical protein